MTRRVIVCGGETFIAHIRSIARATDEVLAFLSGAECRHQIAREGSETPLLIGPELIDVSPVNLVAAIRHDERNAHGRSRCIVLVEQQEPSGSVASRARSAGADRVVPMARVNEVWCAHEEAAARVLVASATAPVVATTTAPAVAAEGVGAPTRMPASPPAVSKRGAVITVASGSGGVGKSTIALLGAIALAGTGAKTVLLDFDLQFGDLAYLLGLHEVHTLYELLSAARGGSTDEGRAVVTGQSPFQEQTALIAQIKAQETIIPGEAAFFACPERPEQGDQVLPAAATLIEAFRYVYDYVIVNTGSFWTEMHGELLRASDVCLLVMDQRLAAVRSCVVALDLCGRLGIPFVRIACLLNRFSSRGTIMVEDARSALRGATVIAIPDGSREVEELIGVGCPQELFALRNTCAIGVAQMMDKTLLPLGLLPVATQSARRLIPEAKPSAIMGLKRGKVGGR